MVLVCLSSHFQVSEIILELLVPNSGSLLVTGPLLTLSVANVLHGMPARPSARSAPGPVHTEYVLVGGLSHTAQSKG